MSIEELRYSLAGKGFRCENWVDFIGCVLHCALFECLSTDSRRKIITEDSRLNHN